MVKYRLVIIMIVSLIILVSGCGQIPPATSMINPSLHPDIPTPTPSQSPDTSIDTFLTLTPELLTYPTYADKIGVDLGGVGDRGLEFMDVALTLRPWETIHADTCPEGDEMCRLAPVDENGNPLSDCRTVFFDLRPFGAWWGVDQANCPFCVDGNYQIDLSGTYKLSFNGQAILDTVEGSLNINNQIYDPASNLTTADIIVSKGQGLLFMTFVETKRTPESSLNSGITNVHLYRPGYSPENPSIFNPDFVRALKPFNTLRFMNWVGGNNIDPGFNAVNNTLTWSERKLPTDLQITEEGVAWDYVIELANETRKNIWINIPIHASDDYIEGLAQLLRKDLHSDAIIYIEYSNEVWNSLFSQYKYNLDAAQSEVDSGISVLNNDETRDPEDWAMRRYAQRLVTISNIFRKVYGVQAINQQIRVILSWHILQPWEYKQQLDWVSSTYGAPEQYFYGIAGAGYFNIESINPNASLGTVFYNLLNSSNKGVKNRIALKQIADEYNLNLCMYEGGPDTSGVLQWERDSALLATLTQAHRDPMMRDLILHDLYNNWFAHPGVRGDMFIYFTLQSAYSRWGMWGLTEDIHNTQTSKYQAMTDLVGITTSIPPIPLDVIVEEEADSAIISWAVSYGAQSYRVYRQKAGFSTFDLITETTTTRYIDPNLDNPKSYFYKVTAINSQGESAVSAPAGASVAIIKPTPTPLITPLEVVAVSAPPNIDGKIDNIWNNAKTYPLTKQLSGNLDSFNDLSAQVSLLYDTESLYLLFQVIDDTPMRDIADNPWDDDSAEVYLDGGNEKAESYDKNDEQLVFLYNGEQPWAQRGRKSGVRYVSATTENGYIIEIVIPWSNIKVKPEPGQIIGFDAHINDDDDNASRDAKIALFAIRDDSWSRPDTFGAIYLLP